MLLPLRRIAIHAHSRSIRFVTAKRTLSKNYLYAIIFFSKIVRSFSNTIKIPAIVIFWPSTKIQTALSLSFRVVRSSFRTDGAVFASSSASPEGVRIAHHIFRYDSLAPAAGLQQYRSDEPGQQGYRFLQIELGHCCLLSL